MPQAPIIPRQHGYTPNLFNAEYRSANIEWCLVYHCLRCDAEWRTINFSTSTPAPNIREYLTLERITCPRGCSISQRIIHRAEWAENGEQIDGFIMSQRHLEYLNGGSVVQFDNNRPHCARCGYFHGLGGNQSPLSEYVTRGGESVTACLECLPQMRREEYIMGHAYQPPTYTFLKGKKESNNLPLTYYGTELEINTSNDPGMHAADFEKWLKSNRYDNYFYFKRDGSISQGYEIVTHPMTKEARNGLINWKAVCEYLRNSGASSHESGECGLHIHASTSNIGPREQAKLKYFVYANRHNIHRFAKRENYRYCNIEELGIRSNKVWGGTNIMRLLTHVPATDKGRYVAVNAKTGKNTVEFRFIRGTIDYPRLLASFQLVDALIGFVKVSSIVAQDTPYSWGSFKSWMRADNNYGHLERYLEKEAIK